MNTITSPFSVFLAQHKYKKDQSKDTITNTRIGNEEPKIYGGSYCIPPENYQEFLHLYYDDVFVKKNAEYFTEKQLAENGPILIDIDFRYDYTVMKKQHTRDHIIDIINLYLEELNQMYQFEEDTSIPVFVFEKQNVNRVEDKKITKDGIHIIIGIQSNPTIQIMLRHRILERIDSIWSDLPIQNRWEDVFDEGISKGTTNWQLIGSQKPLNQPYMLKYIFHLHYEDDEFDFNFVHSDKIPTYITAENIYKFSARYPHHVSLFMKNDFIQEYKQFSSRDNISTNTVVAATIPMSMSNRDRDREPSNITIEELLNVHSQDELDSLVQRFLQSLDIILDYELRETYEYTMILPASYYNEGSFTKWIRVGWALKNTSDRMFIVWVALSAKSPTFSFITGISDLWERWTKMNRQDVRSLTRRSIMYWARQEDSEQYQKIKENTLDFYIEATLSRSLSMSSENKSNIKGNSDFDIATILYHLYKDQYTCVSIKNNIWYQFQNHRWSEIDSGTTLRKAISQELRRLYGHKHCQVMRMIATIPDQEEPRAKSLKKKLDMIASIIDRLGKTVEKKNIMTEAKELFYDGEFLLKMDNDPYLLCFKNGVVDFREKTFRPGTPDDYLSKCTNISYHPNAIQNVEIVEQIEDFMHKLFPIPELYHYMWDHLASTLLGTSTNQTFNMYIGIGQNGKSVLIHLMEKVLGDYKGDVPLTLLTQQRTKIGGLAPELVQLKGVRYAVMQEPSKGDKINEGIMKQITGGDPIQARAPYMPQVISYTPQFKLVVCSNEFMEIKSQDHGTWRRIRVVDFVSLFTDHPKDDDPQKPYQYKLDKNIKEKFEDWKETFACMLVERAFKTGGMVEDCQQVLKSSNSYRLNQDYMAEFIQERLAPHPNKCVQKIHLYNEFKEWYQQNYSGKMPNMKDLSIQMDAKFGKMKSGVWTGVRILPKISIMVADEDADEEADDEEDINFETL